MGDGEIKILNCVEKVIEYGFYGLVFLVPLVFTTATFELFEFPKMILVYLLTILIVSAFLVKGIVAGKFELKKTPLDFPILLYFASYVLSSIFSIDRYTSVFGYYTRFNGGLLSLICYVVLYYIFVWSFFAKASEDERDRFIKLLLLSSLLVSIYGILQHLGIDKDYWVQDVQRRVFSTLGQPNWLAAYLVMIIPVSLALMIKNLKTQNSNVKATSQMSKLFYISLPIVLYTAFWFTYSRSGLLGFTAMLLTFLVFVGKENLRRSWRPLFLVGLSWLVISALTFSPKIIIAAESGPSSPSSERSLKKPTGSTVQIRLAVWKGALNLIKDHPLLGTGPETFAYSFLPYRPTDLNQTAEWEFLYNKAHNEYLNITACTGLLGLGAYLLLIGKFVFWNIRKFTRTRKRTDAKERILMVGVFAGWVGAVVSNFFGFSVVVTSLLFWLYMALSVSFITFEPGLKCKVLRAKRAGSYLND